MNCNARIRLLGILYFVRPSTFPSFFFRNISFEPFNLSTLQGEQFRAVVHQLHQREAAAALQPHGNQPVRP